MPTTESHHLQQLLRLTKRFQVKALVLDSVRSKLLQMPPQQREHLTPAQFDELETQAHDEAFLIADEEAAELEHALSHGGDIHRALRTYLEKQK
jgi:hypothetical protein